MTPLIEIIYKYTVRPFLITSTNTYYKELNYVLKVISESNILVFNCNTLEYVFFLLFDCSK